MNVVWMGERNIDNQYQAWSHTLDKVSNGVRGLVQHFLNVTELKEYHGLNSDQCIILCACLKVRKGM